MSVRCANERCYVHEDEAEGCYDGVPDHTRCSKWRPAEAQPSTQVPCDAEVARPASATGTVRVPWSGNGLGLLDLANLTPRGRFILVGVLGAHDAGKTTLLLGNYQLLLRSGRLADARFAGSRTLKAWESLASWPRSDDAARQASFPPHTSRNAGRVPSLLHLALRGANGGFSDVLLTDAPGEWFTHWAINEHDPEAEGARWTIKHADVFLVFADCQRLSRTSPERGKARSQLVRLLERLGGHAHGRPTVLVWAKSDHKPDATIRDDILQTLRDYLSGAIEAESTTTELGSLAKVLWQALNKVWTPRRAHPMTEPVLDHHPFAAFRGNLHE
jgi:hypothetical protein